MKRNLDSIPVSNEEVMAYAVQSGRITMYRYMQWLMTEKTMEDMKETYMLSMEDRSSLQ